MIDQQASFCVQLGEGGADKDGWVDTGDIATIDTLGHIQLVDRSKDVIKSGGEWISSIEIENAAQGCPGVSKLRHKRFTSHPNLYLLALSLLST